MFLEVWFSTIVEWESFRPLLRGLYTNKEGKGGRPGEMNEQHVACPHPDSMIEKNLRKNGRWIPADVEMALFAYASEMIQR